jgi:hypothetical protein
VPGFFRKLFGLGQESAEAYNARGLAYAEKGDLDHAIQAFARAIELEPRYTQAHFNRGNAHMDREMYDEALADYSRASRLDPKCSFVPARRFVGAANVKLKNRRELPSKDCLETRQTERPREATKPHGKEDGEEQPSRPPARRVAARAIVLSAVAYRALLEDLADNADTEPFRRQACVWLNAVGVSPELDQQEREFLETRIGKADQQTVIDGSWRSEGVAVLAWALKRYELPPYDERMDLKAAGDAVGFLDTSSAKALLSSAELRPSPEIDRVAAHNAIVHWRLRQFSLGPDRMDFPGYLRQFPAFKPCWLDGLRFVEDDLAIGEKCVADTADDEFEACRCNAVERQIAAKWLQGDREVYSEVPASTILSGL